MTRLFLVTGLLTIAACSSVGPEYHRPHVSLPATFKAETATTAENQSVIRNDWWKLFKDPTLDQAMDAALKNNDDIHLAAARIQEASANYSEITGSLLPDLDAQANVSRSRVSQKTGLPVIGPGPFRKDKQIGLVSSFELDFWGKLQSETAAAQAQLTSAKYAHDLAKLSIATLVTNTYVGLRAVDEQIALTRNTLTLRSQTIDLTRKRASGGVASDLDIRLAESARAATVVQLSELEQQRALGENAMMLLTGATDLVIPTAGLDQLPIPQVPATGTPSTLLKRRADIQQAEQDMIAANAVIGSAIADRFPMFTLTGVLGSQSNELSQLLTGGAQIWSLGVGLTAPLFDGGRRVARVDGAKSRLEQTAAHYSKTVHVALKEVADALVRNHQTQVAEGALHDRVEASRQALALAKVRYESGYSSYLELLEAERTLNDAELASIGNHAARLTTTVELIKALGGGWDPESSTKSAAK